MGPFFGQWETSSLLSPFSALGRLLAKFTWGPRSRAAATINYDAPQADASRSPSPPPLPEKDFPRKPQKSVPERITFDKSVSERNILDKNVPERNILEKSVPAKSTHEKLSQLVGEKDGSPTMRSRLSSFKITLRRPKLRAKSTSTIAANRGIRFPIELWIAIFSMIGHESNPHITRDMRALVITCKAFQVQAEVVLYRRVNLLDGLDNSRYSQRLHAFARAIMHAQRPWRAPAVRSLCLYVPHYGSIAAQSMFDRMVKMTDVEIYWDATDRPPFALLWSRLRLHSLSLTARSFCQVHLHKEQHRIALGLARNAEPEFQPLPFAPFSTISSLTLQMGDAPLEDSVETADILRYCSWYNITHLNLSEVPMWSTCREVLLMMGAHLVSFRISLGTRPYKDIPGCSRVIYEAPMSWPTDIVKDATFPLLKHLEVYECYDAFECEMPHLPSYHNEDLPSWRDSCPAIETFIWKPSRYHNELTWYDMRYECRVRSMHKELFQAWPTLRRFERTMVEGGRPCRYIAIERAEGEGERSRWSLEVYDPDSWRKAR